MLSPDGHRAPRQQKPLADADAPRKQERVKGKPFCSLWLALLPDPGLGGPMGFCRAAGGAGGGAGAGAGGGSGGLHTSV